MAFPNGVWERGDDKCSTAVYITLAFGIAAACEAEPRGSALPGGAEEGVKHGTERSALTIRDNTGLLVRRIYFAWHLRL